MYGITLLQGIWLLAALGFLLWVLFWLVVPALSGLPWTPTDLSRAQRALEMAELKTGELLLDLGSGDGRVLLLAARVFGARGLGIEISPLLAWWTNWQARRRGLQGRVRARWGNFYREDLSQADVVYFFASDRHMKKMRAQLESQLRPGARVVCILAAMPVWKPKKADTRALIFVYEMPPQPGGIEAYLLEQVESLPPTPPSCPL